jgi:Transport and Golgi organisation 2
VRRGSVIIAANRDEDPARPSAPPLVLREKPRVVGGRDLLKGGAWLALRGRSAAVAMLNRREEPNAEGPGRRSRGLLALEVAAAGDGTPEAALRFAREAAQSGEFAPFSLLFASPEGCWLLAHRGAGAREAVRVAPGWHAITHADLDDASEPRTRWILSRLAAFAPGSLAEAERFLLDLLRAHGDAAPAGGAPAPPVCLHAGRMRTVSSSIVFLSDDAARYVHIEGRPCTGTAVDFSHLLAAAAPARADRP